MMLPTKAYGTKEGLEYINLSRYVLFSRQWCFDDEKINSNSFHFYPLSMRGGVALQTVEYRLQVQHQQDAVLR